MNYWTVQVDLQLSSFDFYPHGFAYKRNIPFEQLLVKEILVKVMPLSALMSTRRPNSKTTNPKNSSVAQKLLA